MTNSEYFTVNLFGLSKAAERKCIFLYYGGVENRNYLHGEIPLEVEDNIKYYT